MTIMPKPLWNVKRKVWAIREIGVYDSTVGANMDYLKGEPMNSIKSALVTLAAVLIGITLGASLFRPPSVKAMTGIRVQKVNEGYNAVIGSEYLGFACTQTDCYVASR